MSGAGEAAARPASVDDLKQLLKSLNDSGADYLLIGGYALYALGYQRGTTDIDLLVRPTAAQGERVKQALLLLPDGVARDIEGLLKTKQTVRDKDRLDRIVLERALEALRKPKP